jgi:glutathione S-transferase
MFHLTPAAVWQSRRMLSHFVPDGLAAERFIHCTLGEARVIEVGNRYYRSDTRPYVALVIDPERVDAPIRFDDPDQVYPHIYGRLNVDAVIAVRPVERGRDGAFLRLLASQP